MLIPCDEPVSKASILCQSTIRKSMHDDKASLVRSHEECPRNMVVIDATDPGCYMLLGNRELKVTPSMRSSTDSQDNLLLHYLQKWNPDKCLEWCYVTLFDMSSLLHTLRLGVPLSGVRNESTPALSIAVEVADVVNVSVACRYGHYQCPDGTCILRYRQCDGFLLSHT